MATAAAESANDASQHKKIAVTRDTKSLDYIARTMLAGGIAGITVSDFIIVMIIIIIIAGCFLKGMKGRGNLVLCRTR